MSVSPISSIMSLCEVSFPTTGEHLDPTDRGSQCRSRRFLATIRHHGLAGSIGTGRVLPLNRLFDSRSLVATRRRAARSAQV